MPTKISSSTVIEPEWNAEVWGTCAGGDGQATLKTIRALGAMITTSLESVGNLSPYYYNKLQKWTQPWQEVLELQPKGKEANMYLQNRHATGSPSATISCNNHPEYLPCLKGQGLGQTFLLQTGRLDRKTNCCVSGHAVSSNQGINEDKSVWRVSLF